MTKGTVEAYTEKFGPSVKINGTWYKPGDSLKDSLKSLNKGAQIEFDANGKFLNSFKIVGAAPAGASPAAGGGSQPRPGNAEQSRATAVKVAFGSQALADALKTKDLGTVTSTLEQYAVRLERFIMTGSFDPKAE